MGISNSCAQFLLAARSTGVDISTTATIGKQTFWPTLSWTRRLVEAFKLPMSGDQLLTACGKSGDEFLKVLGAKTVTSFDANDYEGADLVHDMNKPLEPSMHQRFSAAFDGGSLEHLFDVRQAMANFMNLVASGGHFVGITAANNLLGHGFYQFSPDFYFRVLSPENGFEIVTVLLAKPYVEPPQFFRVADPMSVGGAVELVNDCPVYLMAIARKVRHLQPFAAAPQQSYYTVAWEDADTAAAAPKNPASPSGDYHRVSLLRRLARRLPEPVKAMIRGPKPQPLSFSQKCFRPLTLEDMTRDLGAVAREQ